MSRDPAKRAANVASWGVPMVVAWVMAWLRRRTRLRQVPPPCAGDARQSATPGLLRKLLRWTHRRSGARPLPDNLSDHMLHDMGLAPDRRADKSHVGFWRGR